jgi:Nucleotidyltransferase domain
MLERRRRARLDVDEIVRVHKELSMPTTEKATRLGAVRWEPKGDARELQRRLRSLAAHPAVIDLILFGSQARGSTTQFSDVDAVLVIDDAAAEDASSLRVLRKHVLDAQRAVISHQPMQHHGFEVATPKLLGDANHALGMPAVALSEARSLIGEAIGATFTPERPGEANARLEELVRHTVGVSAWPRQPWRLHGLISMFELLPTLFLQARGQAVPKWRSFEEARSHFGDGWWPYDVLKQVRDAWPRISAPVLRVGVAVLRNPWLAVAAWSRLPAGRENPGGGALSGECLEALRVLARKMGDTAC